jgi:hypothetical protein
LCDKHNESSENIIQMQARQCGEQNDDATQDNKHADNLVNEFDAVFVKLGTNLVYEPGQSPPP